MIELQDSFLVKLKLWFKARESLDEDLISDYELPYTVEKDYIYIYKDVNKY